MAIKIGGRVAKWSAILSTVDYLVLLPYMIISFVIISNLGPDNYGLFVIASVAYQFVVALIQSFIITPSVRLISILYGKKDNEQLSKLVGLVISTIVFIAIIIILGYIFIMPLIVINVYHRPIIVEYVLIFTPLVIILGLDRFFRNLLLSLSDYPKIALIRILETTFFIVSVLTITSFLLWTIDAIVYAVLISALLTLLSSMTMAKIKLKSLDVKVKPNLDINHLKAIIKLGQYFTIGDILYNIFLRLDVTIMPIFVSDKLIAFYSFAKTIIGRISIISDKVNMLLYPIFSERSGQNDKSTINSLLRKGIAISFLYGIPFSIFLVMFSRELIIAISYFINLTAYLDSDLYLSIFAISIIGQAIAAVIVAYFNGIGRVENLAKANVILLTSSVFLIPTFTFLFSALGTTIAYVTSQYASILFWYIQAKRACTTSMRNPTRILTATVIAAIFTKILAVQILPANLSLIFVIEFLFLSIIFFSIFSILLILINAVTLEDIIFLKQLAGNNRIAKFAIQIIEKVYFLFKRSEGKSS